MPQETAQIWLVIGLDLSLLICISLLTAHDRAIQPPVIDAVLVPPSA